MCVCVLERERETDRKSVCVYVRERERDSGCESENTYMRV